MFFIDEVDIAEVVAHNVEVEHHKVNKEDNMENKVDNDMDYQHKEVAYMALSVHSYCSQANDCITKNYNEIVSMVDIVNNLDSHGRRMDIDVFYPVFHLNFYDDC